MRSVVDRNVVMRRMTTYMHHACKHASLHARTHTHIHTHTLTMLRRNVGFPPNNSEYLERLADKVYHTHMSQCCQYSAVLSLCRAVRSRVEDLSFRHVMYVSILGCRPAHSLRC